MANLSQPSFDYRAIANNPVWGFPEGSSIVDLVLDDMKDVTHPHWKKFPPVTFQCCN
jgi:r-opsin